MEEHFPDVVPLIGDRELADMWVHNPRGALITVKVSGALMSFRHLFPNYPFNSFYLIEFILRHRRIITETAVSLSGMQRIHRFRSMAKG